MLKSVLVGQRVACRPAAAVGLQRHESVGFAPDLEIQLPGRLERADRAGLEAFAAIGADGRYGGCLDRVGLQRHVGDDRDETLVDAVFLGVGGAVPGQLA